MGELSFEMLLMLLILFEQIGLLFTALLPRESLGRKGEEGEPTPIILLLSLLLFCTDPDTEEEEPITLTPTASGEAE